MRCVEPGLLPESECFFNMPTVIAQPVLYHMETSGHFYCNRDYHIKRNNFGSYLMVFVSKGGLHVLTKDGRGLAGPGEIAMVDCHKPHEYWSEEGTEFYFFHFDGANSATIFDYIIKSMGLVFPSQNSAGIQETMNSLIEVSRYNQVVKAIEHSKLIYTILCSVIQDQHEYSVEDEGSRVVSQAIGYIKEHMSEQLSVGEIAGSVGLSVYYFTRLFKKRTGFSPHEYVTHMKIDRAKYLLRTTNDTIREVAYAVGYQSEHNFSMSFTNKVGLSPGKFRKLLI